jgi:hypothetical protein
MLWIIWKQLIENEFYFSDEEALQYKNKNNFINLIYHEAIST